MMRLQSKRVEAARAMEELRLINKQKNNELRKQQEEEMKRKKEEDEAARRREEEATAKVQATAMVQYDPNANPNNENPSKTSTKIYTRL